MGDSQNIINLETGWNDEIKTKALDPLEVMLDDGFQGKSKLFSNKDYVNIYTICYNMCTQRSPYNWSEQLYLRHGETIARYLTNNVLPVLKDRHDEFLLHELVKRGENHEVMNKWLKRFFMYLDRYYVKYHSLPTLEDAGVRHFKTLGTNH
jgi:cullin 1